MSKTLALFDTDEGFEARFRKKLEEEDIDDKYTIARIVPDTTLEPRALIGKCIRDAQALAATTQVAAFFVDIVIYERSPLDTEGVDLAKQLRDAFPAISVFCITSKLAHEETYDPAYDIFSEATLEDFDGVIVKSYLEGKRFSAKRLRRMLEKSRLKHDRRAFGSYSVADDFWLEDAANKGNAFGGNTIDAFTLKQISSLGPSRFWALLHKLLPDADGTLRAITPGRSGASVFKAVVKFRPGGQSATKPKSWIIKILPNRDAANAEAEKHSELVKTTIPRSVIPRLIDATPRGEDGLWGIAYECEDDAETLLHIIGRTESTEGGNRLATHIVGVLKELYGDSAKQYRKVWKEHFSLVNAQLSILSAIAENRIILSELGGDVQRIESFVKSNGDSLHSLEADVDTRHIHGDLNCGNILVTQAFSPVFIDFASRRQDHVAKDVAKLERDLLFRVLDAYTPRYYAWGKIAHLDSLASADEKNFFLDGLNSGSSTGNEKVILSMIRLLRRGLVAISPTTQPWEYLCAMLYYTLLGIAHPALSVQRKAICVFHAGNILESLSPLGSSPS